MIGAVHATHDMDLRTFCCVECGCSYSDPRSLHPCQPFTDDNGAVGEGVDFLALNREFSS